MLNGLTKVSSLASSRRCISKGNWSRMKAAIVQQDKGAEEFHSLPNPSRGDFGSCQRLPHSRISIKKPDKQYLASNYFQNFFFLFVVRLPRRLTGLFSHMQWLLPMDWMDLKLYKQKEDGC